MWDIERLASSGDDATKAVFLHPDFYIVILVVPFVSGKLCGSRFDQLAGFLPVSILDHPATAIHNHEPIYETSEPGIGDEISELDIFLD